MNLRHKRISEFISRELSMVMHTEMRDIRFRAVTITLVQMSPDLGFAKIYFTCAGSEKDIKEMGKALNHAKGYFRTILSGRIDLKYVPDFKFFYDDTLAEAERLDQLFNEIKKNESSNQ
jgi:ribosome-binding factor A